MTNALLPNADGNVKRPVFCASCGSAGDGAFCRLCGAPLHGSEPRQVERATLQGSQAAYAASQPASGRENDGLQNQLDDNTDRPPELSLANLAHSNQNK